MNLDLAKKVESVVLECSCTVVVLLYDTVCPPGAEMSRETDELVLLVTFALFSQDFTGLHGHVRLGPKVPNRSTWEDRK